MVAYQLCNPNDNPYTHRCILYMHSSIHRNDSSGIYCSDSTPVVTSLKFVVLVY